MLSGYNNLENLDSIHDKYLKSRLLLRAKSFYESYLLNNKIIELDSITKLDKMIYDSNIYVYDFLSNSRLYQIIPFNIFNWWRKHKNKSIPDFYIKTIIQIEYKLDGLKRRIKSKC